MTNKAVIPEYSENLEIELQEAIQAKRNIDSTMKIEEKRGNKDAAWIRKHL